MNRLQLHINSRNSLLDPKLEQMHSDLQRIYIKNLLSAGVAQPGYFSDFMGILENYKKMNVIQKYMISEEEHVEGGNFYKIPVIDVSIDSYINNRIFISPF